MLLSRLLRQLIPPGGDARRLCLISMLYAVGSGAFAAVSVVFFTRAIGLSAAQVGLGLSAAAVTTLVLTIPLGKLADRFGGVRVWLAGTVAEACAYALYPAISGVATFVAVVIAVALAENLGTAGRQAYTAAAFPPAERVRVMAYARTASNVGFTAGAMLAGIALALGDRVGYYAMPVSTAVILALAAVLMLSLPRAAHPAPAGAPRKAVGAVRDLGYMAMSGVSGILYSHVTLLGVVFPLWVIDRTDAPDAAVAWLLALNTVLAVALQVVASHGAETAPGAAKAQRHGGFALVAMCGVLAVTAGTSGWTTLALLATAMLLLTLGELWQSAGAWGLSVALAPDERRGEYLSAFRLGGQVQGIVAPAAMSALVVGFGVAGWSGLAAVYLVAALVITPVTRWAQHRRPEPADHAAAGQPVLANV
ncbi:MFS transporter [Catellatospora sichuanensis]|uniref:MFS transporter n=1 Tax=Catellatospora sichuanensis TaxID=1969805 RepID=UPI0011827A0D|nr:MFS transporter [Catellatospora sichuanensis]